MVSEPLSPDKPPRKMGSGLVCDTRAVCLLDLQGEFKGMIGNKLSTFKAHPFKKEREGRELIAGIAYLLPTGIVGARTKHLTSARSPSELKLCSPS